MHTDRSDGRLPPDALLDQAFAGRLDVVAVADHDLPNVLRPGLHTRDGRQVRVLAAAEVSGCHEGRELHLLVYFPGEMPDTFRALLRSRAMARAERYDAALGRLGLAGLAPADPAARQGERSLTRHHLVAALRAAQHIATARQGFALLQGGSVVPLIELPFVDAIRAAREAGGLTSWAHPSLADAQAWTPTFVRAGLQGLEGVRPGLDRRTRNGLKNLAEKYGLLLTGGSDWHGWSEPPLGTFAVTGERARDFMARLDGGAA
jgi:predicted metal-dependent phosphoesterase TrpH